MQKELERIDDASTEIMMADEGKVLLFVGGAFFETSEEEATTHCEETVEQMQEKIRTLESEEGEIMEKQDGLKKILYGRFGKSIQLEEKYLYQVMDFLWQLFIDSIIRMNKCKIIFLCTSLLIAHGYREAVASCLILQVLSLRPIFVFLGMA